jgi:hypothetical protein
MPDTPTGETAPAELFAAYTQVRIGEPAMLATGTFARRWQFIVMPSHTIDNGEVLYLSREQDYPKHKSRWQTKIESRSSMLDNIATSLASYTEMVAGTPAEARYDTPLVIGMNVDELATVLREPNKAPWDVLKRAARVSAQAGGYIIL